MTIFLLYILVKIYDLAFKIFKLKFGHEKKKEETGKQLMKNGKIIHQPSIMSQQA